jgi:low affinity Fe/Cu permease
MNRPFALIATRVATWVGQPLAFALALASILLWLVTGPIFDWLDTWQLIVLMVFLIQNSQNRDAAAMQAKLDEVIRALRAARNEFIGIEHLTDGEIELIRTELERAVAAEQRSHHPSESVGRLLNRR